MAFVTTKLFGRLGNQLFQVAATIALAMRNGADYYIPNIARQGLDNPYFSHFPELPAHCRIESTYCEPSHAYSPIPYSPNMCLDGYWQSHKYWEDLQEKILPLFNINPVIRPDTVSIHRRLGDFRNLTEKHNLITDDYIKRAIRHFTDRGFYRFMIFSDEIELCKPMFQSPGYNNLEITFSEGKTPLEDMAEYSGCAHQIGSASTFSFWGYYFNTNPDKTIILPNNLWGVSHQNIPQSDMVPPNCIQIPN